MCITFFRNSEVESKLLADLPATVERSLIMLHISFYYSYVRELHHNSNYKR